MQILVLLCGHIFQLKKKKNQQNKTQTNKPMLGILKKK